MANFNLAQVFMDTVHADVIFVVDDKEIPAHRVILAKTCPYFDKLLFSHFMESKSKKVKITGTSAKIFQEVMRFTYTGKLEIDNWTIEDLLSLLAVAHEYQFQPLFSAVIEALEVQPLDLDSWSSVNSAAAIYDSGVLRRKCTSFTEEKMIDFLNLKDLGKFSAEFLYCMLDRPKMSTYNQDNVVKAICKWKQGQSSPEINSLLQKICWNKVSPMVTAIAVKELLSLTKNADECPLWTKLSEDIENPSENKALTDDKAEEALICIAKVDSLVLSKDRSPEFTMRNNKGLLFCGIVLNRIEFLFKTVNGSWVDIPVKGIEFESETKFSIEKMMVWDMNYRNSYMWVSEPSENNGWFKYSAVFPDTTPVYLMHIYIRHVINAREIRLRNLVIR